MISMTHLYVSFSWIQLINTQPDTVKYYFIFTNIECNSLQALFQNAFFFSHVHICMYICIFIYYIASEFGNQLFLRFSSRENLSRISMRYCTKCILKIAYIVDRWVADHVISKSSTSFLLEFRPYIYEWLK